jgi:hypothetical protein
VHVRPTWCVIGQPVRADPPTLPKPITGVVDEVDGLIVTLRTASGMAVAVDVEDCRPATRRL